MQVKINKTFLVAARELKETFQDTRFVYTTVVTGLALPIFYAYISMSTVRALPTGVASTMFPVWFLLSSILPASFSMQLALASFVGEKENRTIEPLLAAPISNRELFVGKVISSFIPPLVLVAIVQAVFLGASFGFARLKYRMPFSPDLAVIGRTALFVPLVILFMVACAVLLSARSTSMRSAQQVGAFINLPIIFLVVYKAPQILDIIGKSAPEVLAVGVAVNILLLRIGIRMFNRERILTQIG
ncbi:MAG: ABC transporter permease [Firmicutes bacterium]|nr:ABC transporter permease [Bacillota bacterium]